MLNSIIQPRRINCGEIIRKMSDQVLFVDNSFQRRLVWTEKQKIRLIETILIGYPMPEIYLWEQMPDTTQNIQRQSIVDGQQRLSAIYSFYAGEFVLKKSALDAANRDGDFSGCYWCDLSADLKQHFLQYEINARAIPSSTSDTEIRGLFSRLNETDKSLNPQELRHAQLHGHFLQAAEDMANLDFWKAVPLFSQSAVRRMKDVEFSSSLLTFLRKGIVSDTPSSLNSMYDQYSDSYRHKNKDFEMAEEILKKMKVFYNRGNIIPEFIVRETHFYTIFVLVYSRISQRKSPITTAELDQFFDHYKKFDPEKEHDSKTKAGKIADALRRYRLGSSYRISSKSSREQRVFALQDFLALL